MSPEPKTSKPQLGVEHQHHLHPVVAWFCFLFIIIEWYSRKVLGWRLSNTIYAGFGADCWKYSIPTKALILPGGSFTGLLLDNGIAISMDGQLTIFLSNGSGGQTNMRICICRIRQHARLTVRPNRLFQVLQRIKVASITGLYHTRMLFQIAKVGGAKIVDRFSGTWNVPSTFEEFRHCYSS